MIKFDKITLQRGGQPLIEGADLTLDSGQRYGLVGRNGAGKTTLFKLLLGQLQLDAGQLTWPPAMRMAHMAQEIGDVNRSTLDHVLDGDQALRKAELAMIDTWDSFGGFSSKPSTEKTLVNLEGGVVDGAEEVLAEDEILEKPESIIVEDTPTESKPVTGVDLDWDNV